MSTQSYAPVNGLRSVLCDQMIAYFSMEVGLSSTLPTYSGGLGVLAGDTLRAAADIGLPMVGVTLLYRKGYFKQSLDGQGQQSESPVEWDPKDHLEALSADVEVSMEGRKVKLRSWRYIIKGASGHQVPVYFLDAAHPDNTPEDQALTDSLYGGDDRYRLAQEIVLGMGGIALLDGLASTGRLSQAGEFVYHMNEGHSALLTLALLEKRLDGRKTLKEADEDDLAWVRSRCIFTTHTPVPAGHDRFAPQLTRQLLGESAFFYLQKIGACQDGMLNMTSLALRFSRFANGVAKKHGEVSRDMFPKDHIHAITNGVHAASWTAEPMQKLFDQEFPDWRRDNFYIRYMCDVPVEKIQAAHGESKRKLLATIRSKTGASLDPKVFTIGFARRATPYKRADILLHDMETLRAVGKKAGPIQILYAGKAHPKDMGGKEMIARIVAAKEALAGSNVSLHYIPGYDMAMGLEFTSGVDLWLNTPAKPLEASGTSGMKAALNGVPSLSTLDGWWVEGLIEGVTGWEIEDPGLATAADWDADASKESAAAALYSKLEQTILPLYYESNRRFGQVMRGSIAFNGSHFTTQRMMLQYATMAYSAPTEEF